MDWGRGEHALPALSLLIVANALAVANVAVGFGRPSLAQAGNYDPGSAQLGISWAYDGVLVLCLVAVLASLIVMLRRYYLATRTAAVNLRSLAEVDHVDSGGYTPELEVRSTGRPLWFTLGATLAAVALLASSVAPALYGRVSVSEVIANAACPLGLALASYLTWRQRQAELAGPRPPGGRRMLALSPDGLYVAYLKRTVPWSDVMAAEVAPHRRINPLPLALRFTLRDTDPAPADSRLKSITLRDPANTLIFPLDWLDADPVVILANARQFIAVTLVDEPHWIGRALGPTEDAREDAAALVGEVDHRGGGGTNGVSGLGQ